MCSPLKFTRSFPVQSADRRSFIILEYLATIRVRDPGGFTEAPGLKKYCTSEGFAVTPLSEGAFEIIDLGNLLVRPHRPPIPALARPRPETQDAVPTGPRPLSWS